MRRTTELRDDILNAARTEFARYGLAGARIDRIAGAAHASKERLYAHFGNKEALFREVFVTDGVEFFRSVTLRPEDVAEFVGGVYDLACRRPEHLRMITWARLEGLDLSAPEFEEEPPTEAALAAIDAAQTDGHIDPSWRPEDLLVMLFSVGLAWAHLPHPDAVTQGAEETARRRDVAIEAARRLIAPRT
ncbi:TetR family transcriptional regulator [Mycolicibacterium neoaurum]|uniref:TetR family transcriptional regulator n=1 Tax=Mycolicibacterium neoaurum TaxID=1795 RepID=A0AAV2WSY3_MYCNE|nr:TetR family transcriptional regulator [Mycolicibacterium neoaurum]TLH48922.1 TetR/AcrR family transcriptional regulator [Mycolicibacterium neoaurum]CDQ47234.1 TetR family transcriptional regulator [Mycolicibacterium neoaurum]